MVGVEVGSMQQPSGRTQAQESSPSARDPGFLSPSKVFVGLLIVLVVLVIAAVLLIDSKDENGQAASGSEQTQATGPTGRKLSPTLTDEEAIAKFKSLNRLRLRAYRTANQAFVSLAFESGSRVERLVAREIHSLKDSSVSSRTKFDTLSLRVLSTTPSRLRVQQRVIVTPRFVSQKTKQDVTRNPRKERDVINWTLTRGSNGWRITRSAIVNAQVVAKKNG